MNQIIVKQSSISQSNANANTPIKIFQLSMCLIKYNHLQSNKYLKSMLRCYQYSILSNHQNKMIEITSVIQAPIATVRSILFDFPKYPEWNPFITKIIGQFEEKGQIHVDIQLPDQSSPNHFDPFILVKNQNQFRWLGMLCCSCFFSGEHYFILKELGQNRTQFLHGEVFSGCLTPLFSCLTEKQTRKGFQLMNVALKQRAEDKKQISANTLIAK